MKRVPTEVALTNLADSVRALWRKPTDKAAAAIDRTLLDNLERRLAAAVRRDRTGSTERDGFPSSTLGGGGGQLGPGSTTEAAALSKPERDRHHDLTVDACEALEAIATNIQVLRSRLNSIDDLTDERGPAPRTCQACTGHRSLGGDQPVAHRGTVGDRLTTAVDLCISCYRFVEYTTKPATRLGLLPTAEQIRQHDMRGRWSLRSA